MKKRLIIAGAVAGYLIIESFVFFLYSFVAFNGVEQAVIVSTLGLCAALVYGNRPSPTKALTIVCIVIGFLPVWLGPVSLMAYLLGLLYGTPENALTNLIVFAILGWTVTIVVVVKVTRKLHRRRIPGEADHWLAERAKYRDMPASWHRRNRLRRLSLWLPSALVVLMLFFWAPVTGVLDRVFHPGRDRFGSCHIRLPYDWGVIYTATSDGARYVASWKLRGMARAAIFWNPKPPTISTISFDIADSRLADARSTPGPENQPPIRRDRNGIRQSIRFGAGSATCWRYPPESPTILNIWLVDCVLMGDGQGQAVEAFFEGTEADIPVFYGTLSRIRFKD